MQIDLYIGNDKLEVFGNENITLTSSVTDINDITKNLTDITKSFTIPASDINNAIFKHYYNANIDNTFDARTKVEGRIELDGMPFRYGKYRLEKVSVKNGQPSVYTIQFWGKGINLKDIIGADELSSLEFPDLVHEYNSTNVKAGLTNGLFGGDLVYNLISNKQYYYNSNGADAVQTPTLSNIAFNNGGLAGVVWSDLKASVRLIKIIEAIESKYGIVFSREFFNREEFTKLYLWLNTDAKKNTTTFAQEIDFNGGDSTWMNLTTNTGTFTNYSNAVFNYRRYIHSLNITPSVGNENTPYNVVIYVDGVVHSNTEYVGFSNSLRSSGSLSDRNSTYTLRYEVVSIGGFSYSGSLLNIEDTRTSFSVSTEVSKTTTASVNTILSNYNVSVNMPKMKTIDFLRGLFSMFKLIIKIEDNDLIYINPIKDYYAEGTLYDITDYVDSDNYEVERGKLLNPINFMFEEPTTLLNTQFKDNTGLAYGDEELILEDIDGNKLDGDSFDVKLPFEQMVYERLIDINDSQNTNVMYAGAFDDKIDPVNPKPHIFYNQNVALGSKSIGFINGSGAKEQISTTINIPSHTLGFTNPQFSTVWGREFNEWDGIVINNTLYSNYYSDYITSVFNIKKRSFKYDAVLPLRIQLKLDLNDVIQIKEDYYRIENYNFNLLNGKTEFNLINSFDNTINAFGSDRTDITVNYQAQTESIYVTNGGNFSFNKVDVGFGVSWVTVSNIGSNVYFAFEQNLTGALRVMQVEVQNTETLQTILITLNQTDGSITFDNNVVTFDNTNLTFDNQ